MFIHKAAHRVCGFIAGAFLLMATSAANASLIGDIITVTNEGPGLGNITNSQDVMVTMGNEMIALGGAASADVNAASIELTWARSVATQSGQFNGYVFSGLDWLPDAGMITGFTLDTNIAGITEADITTSANSIAIDIQGTTRSNVSFLNVFLETSHGNQIPEPSAIVIFGLGLAGLGFARRRKVAARLQFGR